MHSLEISQIKPSNPLIINPIPVQAMTQLYCILCLWNEEDIIGSTVRHAYAQGCDRVFVLDNDSSDRTVQQAVRAGAVYHAKFASRHFDEVQKTVYLNKCVAGLNQQLPHDRNWWLYLDADEFPDFHNGKSIKQNLAELPDDVRAVGGFVCNHLPTHEPYFIPGRHPADCMPLGILDRSSIWKFNLLRHDKDQPPLYSRSGAHTYNANGGAMGEADIQFVIHHFNYRTREAVAKRLAMLLERDADGKSRIDWMDELRRLAGYQRSAYHSRFETLDEVYHSNRYRHLKTLALEYDFKRMCRWYDPLELTEMEFESVEPHDAHIFRATLLYHLEHYKEALLAFRAAAEDAPLEQQDLLRLCIARCAKKTADPSLELILAPLVVHPDEEIRESARGLALGTGQNSA